MLDGVMNLLFNAECAKETRRSQKDNAFKSLRTLRILCALCVNRTVAEVRIALKGIDVSRWLSHSDFQNHTQIGKQIAACHQSQMHPKLYDYHHNSQAHDFRIIIVNSAHKHTIR